MVPVLHLLYIYFFFPPVFPNAQLFPEILPIFQTISCNVIFDSVSNSLATGNFLPILFVFELFIHPSNFISRRLRERSFSRISLVIFFQVLPCQSVTENNLKEEVDYFLAPQLLKPLLKSVSEKAKWRMTIQCSLQTITTLIHVWFDEHTGGEASTTKTTDMIPYGLQSQDLKITKILLLRVTVTCATANWFSWGE